MDENLYALLCSEYSDCSLSATVRHYRGLKTAQEAMQKAYEIAKDAWNVPDDSSEFTDDNYVKSDDVSIYIRDGSDEIRWEIVKVEV